MDIRAYIDSLFTAYEETVALTEFKEELQSNLSEHINSLKQQGLDSEAAFAQATAELGDISLVAEEISLRKKQEVFEEMYLGGRKYLDSRRIILYIGAGMCLCLGLIFAAVTWYATAMQVAALGSAQVFCVAGVAVFTFLGLTQETAARYPMPWKRAALYGLAVGVFVFGLFTVPLTYFAVTGPGLSPAELAAHGAHFSLDDFGLMTSISTLLPFVVPSLALLAFLLLSEKDRSKPWVHELRKKALERELNRFANPAQSERFGLFSGALWIGAIALFVLLTFFFGLRYSWLAIVAAIIGQLLLLAGFSKQTV